MFLWCQRINYNNLCGISEVSPSYNTYKEVEVTGKKMAAPKS